MVTWAAFQEQAGALGAFAGERVEGPGLVLVATLRRDGWPRISPVEPLLFDGRLYLGMMWRSTKALDLLRDPRVLVHSVVSRKDGSEGDVKVYGRALEVRDPGERERYCVALQERIGWRPEDDRFHLFAVDVEWVGCVRFGEGRQRTETWRPGGPPTLVERSPGES
jgi:hypothetical protein